MSMPYFALYPVDFLADVGHLGNTELGIYWRLLLVYYRDGKPLPCDTDRLRRIAMTFSPEENRCLDAVVSEFFTMSTEPDGTRVWRNRRADHEIERALSIYANKVGGAKKARDARAARMSAGGVVGAGANELPPPDQVGEGGSDIKPEVRPISTGESEPEPDSTKSGEKTRATELEPELFERMWAVYPRREGRSRASAVKAWNARIRGGYKAQTLLDGAERYAAYCEARKVEQRYMKQPDTFFGPDLHFINDWTPQGTSRPSAGSTAGMNYKEGYGPNGEII